MSSMLTAHGPGAERIADLWWLMFWVGLAVYAIVLALLSVPWMRARRGSARVERPDDNRRATSWILVGGFAVPLVILTLVFVVTLRALAALHPAEADSDLRVEVIGRQWWWDIHYSAAGPSERLATANEIHIPVGRRVRLELDAADVIHSLWIPSLNGKTDLVPGKRNSMWIQADTAGVYRGQCAEFCGLQHTRMEIYVVAHAPADYARWVAAQRTPGVAPGDSLAEEGQRVFMSARCALCHTIRGTPAGGRVGPDLTHFASRRTIAAGTLPNRRGFLSGWIANPQHLKPGTQMPPTGLPGPQLQAVVHYLESLR